MAFPCPICENLKFRKAFDELLEAGADLTAAKKYCENELVLPEGKVCSTYRIKVHALKHSGVDPDRLHPSFMKEKRPDPVKVAAERMEKQVTAAVIETYMDEVATINIDEVLSSIGVDGKPTSMNEILTMSQQIGLSLHMITGAIAHDRLQKFCQDPEGRRFPTTELKGAAVAAEMFDAAFGYSQAVNVQSALDTVERTGLKVSDPGSGNKPEIEGS